VGVIPISKKCPLCGRNKKFSFYYTHRDNVEEYGFDNICKQCAQAMTTSKEGMLKYCSISSRKFHIELWTWAEVRVNEKYKADPVFNALSKAQQAKLLSEKIASAYFGQMGQIGWYEFAPNEQFSIKGLISEDNDVVEIVPRKKIVEQKVYSKDWMGDYTRDQISWLDEYYANTCRDFMVVSRIHQDYAKKIAKASLSMDELYNAMINGETGADKKYEKSKNIFDGLSISAKFSEKTRSTSDVLGFTSLSEIVAELEQTGFLQKKIVFEKDHIDKISEDFRWTISSVGGEF